MVVNNGPQLQLVRRGHHSEKADRDNAGKADNVSVVKSGFPLMRISTSFPSNHPTSNGERKEVVRLCPPLPNTPFESLETPLPYILNAVLNVPRVVATTFFCSVLSGWPTSERVQLSSLSGPRFSSSGELIRTLPRVHFTGQSPSPGPCSPLSGFRQLRRVNIWRIAFLISSEIFSRCS